MNINGRDTLVLFDVMSHSQASYVFFFVLDTTYKSCFSDSGIGDHGIAGIKSFLEQHACNYVCKGFNLTSLSDSAAASVGAAHLEGEGEEDELYED